MILLLPKRFDINEWFIIIASLAGFIMIWRLPKRFPRSVSFIVSLVPLLFSKLFDTFLLLPPLQAFYINDLKKVEIFDLLLYILYIPSGYLFLYAYDRLNPKALGTVLMITVTSLLAVLFEWIQVLIGVFHYTGWHIIYSLPVYILVQSFYIILFERIKREYIRTKR